MYGPDLEFYSSADVDAVQWLMRDLPPKLKRLGIWEGYDRYDRNFRKVLAPMEKRGIPVSKKKLEELRGYLDGEVRQMDAELQALVPSSMKSKKYWKAWPADTKGLVNEYKQEQVTSIVAELEATGKKVTKKAITLVVKPEHLPETWRRSITDLCGYEWEGDLLYKELDFNPRSSDQLLRFIKDKGYPVPKRFRDKKDTTSDKELERLEAKTKDPVLTLVRRIRAYTKMGNAYTGKLVSDGSIEGGWQPGPDGRLRATVGYKSTGQLAAKNPNTMTLPKRRKELAKRFRQCIEAPDGYKLIEFDYKAFHSLTTALESRDKVMYRLAPIDPHSFVAGHMVKFPGIETCLDLNDADLTAYLKEVRKQHARVRDFQAKPAGHGTNFGQKARRLYFEYSEYFENEREAQKLLDLMGHLFPDLFKWQKYIVEKADNDGRLISKWGYIRWFWDAMKWERDRDGRWVRKPSKGAPAAMAFFPANDAHIMLREKLLQADENGWLDRYGFINPVHDALWFLCPDQYVDECLSEMKAHLESPVPQLADPIMCPDGFVCKVDGSIGKNLGEMEEIK